MKSNVRRTRIANVVAQQAQTAKSKAVFSREVAAYLIAEGRTDELNSILRDVSKDWADDGFVEVTATSAHPLTIDLHEEVLRLVQPLFPKAKEFKVTDVYDPDVIGGVHVSVANLELDLTLEEKIDRFRQLTATGKD